MSEWDSPPFGGVGGGFLGRLSPLQRYTLHVTFLLMEFSWGGREGIVLLLYILYIIIILFIF